MYDNRTECVCEGGSEGREQAAKFATTQTMVYAAEIGPLSMKGKWDYTVGTPLCIP